MKIPNDPLERWQLYREVANACLVSRQDRMAAYEIWRSYYLWGASLGSEAAAYNKIEPSIDLFTSHVFAGETTKFGIELGDSVNLDVELPKVAPMKQRLNTNWHRWNTDITYGGGLEWSCCYGSMLLKFVVRGKRQVPYLVEPHNFGVLREDMAFLDDQEAFVHVYTISKSAFSRLLADHTRRKQIEETVQASMRATTHDAPAGVQRILMSTFPMSGTGESQGRVNNLYGITDRYRARVYEETIELRELWVWNDDENDFQVATLDSGGTTVYDRPSASCYIKHEHPFTAIVPLWQYDYFWGRSMVDGVTNLQDLREIRLAQIRELLDRQVKPPTSQVGQWQGIPDETDYAAQAFGAGMRTTDPTAKLTAHYPTVPQDTFTEVREIDAMFDEKMGQPRVVQGKGEAGVRSRSQTTELARLGSARTKKKAFTLEDGLEKIGYLMARGMQVYDDTPMWIKDESGKNVGKFIPEQFPRDFSVKIDGHSSSPVFLEDQKQAAFDLFTAKAIDREELIDLVAPPSRQELKHGLKNIEKKEQAAAAAAQALEEKKISLKQVK